MAKLFKACNSLGNFLRPRLDLLRVPNRGGVKLNPPPKKRYPPWLPKQHRVLHKDEVTKENTKFVQEVIESKYGPCEIGLGMTARNSPLKIEPIEPQTKWDYKSRRTGVLAKKIGIYPLWLKNGKKVLATLLQVADNHVIKYIPPENYHPMIVGRNRRPKTKYGCLIVGAESCDPQQFTKEYCGMFTESGVMPKKLLARFHVTANAALQPGTPLYAAHFRPGDYVDIRGKTVDRGFQGVMKRWGFHGMPATHGVTKTHRRPGNIGSGGTKARVMPGTKMPGHMGNCMRLLKSVQILRVNTKYNVIWVRGPALPGETNTLLQIFDTILPHKRLRQAPHFPTYIPKADETLAEDLYSDDVHPYGDPTLEYKEQA